MNTRLSLLEKEKSEDLYKNSNYTFINIAKELGRDERSIRGYLNSIGYVAKSQSELQRKYELNEKYFDNVDTEDKAYFLGFLFADGYNNIKKKAVCLSLKEDDKDILLKLNNLIQPTKPLFYIDMSPINRGYENSKNQYRLTISSVYMSDKLASIGCGSNKTNSLYFPNYLKDSLIHHFVRGYFDGDGSVSNGITPRVDIISTISFLGALQTILKNQLDFNITKLNRRRKDVENEVRSLQISGFNQCIKFKEWLYKDATIFLERKKKVFDDKYNNKKETDEN